MFDQAQKVIARSAKAYAVEHEYQEPDADPEVDSGEPQHIDNIAPQLAPEKPITKKEVGATAAGSAGAGTLSMSDITDAAEKAQQAKEHSDQLGITDVFAQLIHYPSFWIGVIALVGIAGYLGFRWYQSMTIS